VASLPNRAGVVVVGGGVMGASIAYHVALRDGSDVLLLERHGIGSGCTRHSTAIVRMHYSQALLVGMAVHGLRTYSAFEQAVGRPAGFVRTGLLVGAADVDVEALRRNVVLGQSLGVSTELLDPEDLGQLDPRIDPDGLGALCFEPEAGYCDPYLATTGFADAARREGARVEEGVEVLGIAPGVVQTALGSVETDAVVLAAGPWSPRLLAPLDYDLPLTAARAEVGRFRLPSGFGSPLPSLADFSELQLYFRPAEPGFLEVGSLDPRHAQTSLDPDRAPEGADPARLDAYRTALVRRLPGARHGHWRGAWSGVYDVTPDWHPAVGAVPGAEGVYIAAGFSGHGFKLAPAVGLALAELICNGRSQTFELDLLAPDRFARGELVGTAYGYSVLG
jgi:sarcosine oxidase, subunit beta